MIRVVSWSENWKVAKLQCSGNLQRKSINHRLRILNVRIFHLLHKISYKKLLWFNVFSFCFSLLIFFLFVVQCLEYCINFPISWSLFNFLIFLDEVVSFSVNIANILDLFWNDIQCTIHFYVKKSCRDSNKPIFLRIYILWVLIL